jgi:hypothetical protein
VTTPPALPAATFFNFNNIQLQQFQLQQLVNATPYDHGHAGVSDVGRNSIELHQGEAHPTADAARCACLLLKFVASSTA